MAVKDSREHLEVPRSLLGARGNLKVAGEVQGVQEGQWAALAVQMAQVAGLAALKGVREASEYSQAARAVLEVLPALLVGQAA